jgi:hypothetical protein
MGPPSGSSVGGCFCVDDAKWVWVALLELVLELGFWEAFEIYMYPG